MAKYIRDMVPNSIKTLKPHAICDEDGNITGYTDPPRATYCWVYMTPGNEVKFISQDHFPFETFAEDEDLGAEMGTLTKLELWPNIGNVKWAGPKSPSPVRQKVVDRWKTRKLLVAAERI
jgi:hypothetical protein